MSDDLELWERYARSPDRETRDLLILRYRPLVQHVANQLANGLPHSVENADLVSYGIFGLIDAIERFDMSRGYKFETYAMVRIKGAILDELRNITWTPRSVRDRARAHDQAVNKLESRLHRHPTSQEIADELGVTVEQYFELVQEISIMRHSSLETTVEDPSTGERIHLSETLPGVASAPLGSYEIEELRAALIAAINRLPERLSIVLHLYYAESLTHAEIATVLGVIPSRASQLHSQAMRGLWTLLTTES